MARADETKKRISLLQDWLRAHQYAGIFVPRTDFWQGEEVMPCDERLAWLTGFTGSAGMALVLQAGAGLFVDGRYTLQAAREVDGAGIETCHFADRPWQDWIGSMQGHFAVDPKLVSCGWADRTEKLLAERSSRLVMLDGNPVDTLWIDQPPPAFTPVEVFPLELAGEAGDSKRQRLGEQLKARGLDGAFITDPTGIAWLLNMRAQDYAHTPVALSAFWLKNDGSGIWLIDPARLNAEAKAHLGSNVAVQPPAYFVQQTKIWAGQTVLLDEATAAAFLRTCLQAAGAKIKLDKCVTALAKACKNPTEIEGMQAAHRRDGVALAKFLHWFASDIASGQSNLTESAITNRLESSRAMANEYRGASFETICGFGASGAVVHYRTTPETDSIVAGDNLLLIDSGGQYVDGTTDVTRTLAVGNPSEDHRIHYTLVLKGHIALASARFPVGTTGQQLDALARSALWAEGLNYDHGTGHGVGHYLSVHEGPQGISSRGTAVALQPGMVLSNEPGCYISGEYGIRIENLIAVKESTVGKDGRAFLEFETLTLAPYDRSLIMADRLTDQERLWVNAYHAQVLEKIGLSLDGDAASWLQQACAPL